MWLFMILLAHSLVGTESKSLKETFFKFVIYFFIILELFKMLKNVNSFNKINFVLPLQSILQYIHFCFNSSILFSKTVIYKTVSLSIIYPQAKIINKFLYMVLQNKTEIDMLNAEEYIYCTLCTEIYDENNYFCKTSYIIIYPSNFIKVKL